MHDSIDLHAFAVAGARLELERLHTERDHIFTLFPQLRAESAAGPAVPTKRKPGRPPKTPPPPAGILLALPGGQGPNPERTTALILSAPPPPLDAAGTRPCAVCGQRFTPHPIHRTRARVCRRPSCIQALKTAHDHRRRDVLAQQRAAS